ncbi:MAG: lipoyl(octanoyl) transferase LipB [Alphaproteobacteria bacterium]|nr:lipoyl(octanoyl) transferase LipB [Alphaproteobacteria bacterium]
MTKPSFGPDAQAPRAPVEWRISAAAVPYQEAVSAMEARVAAIRDDRASEQVWLLEHPPLYTAGTSAKDGDLLLPGRFPVHRTGRGGQYTYHGPGQRVAYVMLDLAARSPGGSPDLRGFVRGLERWLIETLATFGVVGEMREGRVGVWVELGGGREAKIAAIGVRVRRGVSFHGISLNVDPELNHYDGIVACGIREHGVTSLAALGISASMAGVDQVLRQRFETVFDSPTIG